MNFFLKLPNILCNFTTEQEHTDQIRDCHQRIGENHDTVGGLGQAHAVIEQQEETGGQHDARHGEDQHPAQLKRLTGQTPSEYRMAAAEKAVQG